MALASPGEVDPARRRCSTLQPLLSCDSPSDPSSDAEMKRTKAVSSMRSWLVFLAAQGEAGEAYRKNAPVELVNVHMMFWIIVDHPN